MKKRTTFTMCAAALLLGSLLIRGFDQKAQAKEAKEQKTDDAVLQTPATAGALHVEGTHLVGEHGEPVQLKGISTHGIAWFPDYINDACFAQFRNEWHANLMRLAMYTAESGGYCTDGDKEYLKSLIDKGVSYATANDMYVIIDWHILSDNNPNMHIEEAKAFFDEIAAKYAGFKNVLYEICNEPNGGTTWQDIKAYAEEIIPVIRSHDEDGVIIVGTPNWSQFVDQAAADPITGYDNLMYTLHFYAATHKEDLRAKMTAAADAGLPIFVSEYGITDASGNGALDIEQANLWVDTMNQYGISYAMWSLSNKAESSAMLKSSCTKTSGFTLDDLNESGQWLYHMLTSEPDADKTAKDDQDGQQESETQTEAPDAQVFESNGLEVSAVLSNSWEAEGKQVYQYNLTLKNISESDCASWEIDVPFTGEIAVSDGWNGNYTAEGSVLHITSKDYNGTIAAGAYITDIGFILSGGTIRE